MNTVLFFKFFGGLIAIMNPLTALPIFLSLTKSHTKFAKIRLAFTTSVAVALILALVAYLGNSILSAFGITVGAFQIAGGIIVGMIALAMLHPKPADSESEKHMNPAIVPMAIPMMAGPGAISKTIAFGATAHSLVDFTAIMTAIVCGATLIFLVFSASNLFNRVLGKTGISTVTKIMAMILGAIAVEMIIQGIRGEF